jgi:hypothetical protein
VKILVFRIKSLLPGRRCWDPAFEGRIDVQTFEGTREHLAQVADVFDESAHPSLTSDDVYKMNLAQTIREAIGIANKTAGQSFEALREAKSRTHRRRRRPPLGGIY